MSYPPPKIMGHCAEEMRLICYANLNPSECYTAQHAPPGGGPARISGIAICDAGSEGVYLFMCDDAWQVIFDSCGKSVEHVYKNIATGFPKTNWQWLRS